MSANEEVRTTQQSLDYADYSLSPRKPKSIVYQQYIENFCSYLSFSLKDKKEASPFYYTDSEELRSLVGFYRYTDEHDFDRLICSVIHDLLVFGKAHVERVLVFDKEDKLVKILFKPIRCIRKLKIFNKLYYRLKKYDGKGVFGYIECKNLICFDVRKVGYSLKYFKRILHRLNKCDLIDCDYVWLQKNNIDFGTYKKHQEAKHLEFLRDLHWTIDWNNYFLTEPHLLYHRIKFQLQQKRFLDYVLAVINQSLQALGAEYGFSGDIKCRTNTENHEALLQSLQTGEKNCKEICDCVFQI